MIRLKNQQFLKIEIEGQDIVDTETLNKFVVIEEAGNYLPTFELDFVTQDLDLLKKIKETTPIKAIFGTEGSESLTTEFVILEKEFSKSGNSYKVNLKGIYNASSYLYDPKIASYDDFSVNVIRQVVGRTFKEVDFTKKITKDKQVWIQYNIPDRKFVSEVWLHSYLSEDDFLLIGITSFGKFKCLSFKDILQRKPWKAYGIHRETLSDREFLYEGDITIQSKTGFINKLVSSKEVIQYDILNNQYQTEILQFKPLLGLTTDLDASLQTKLKSYYKKDDDNVHQQFFRAYERNLAYLLLLSRTEVELSYTAKFYPHEVLDPVYVIDTHPRTKGFEDLYAGLYIISKVVRIFANKSMRTSLTLVRDTLNLE
jgi:hypothetical protein